MEFLQSTEFIGLILVFILLFLLIKTGIKIAKFFLTIAIIYGIVQFILSLS